MLKLYHHPVSFNSRRVWVALLEKELKFELVEMKLNGDQFQPEFLEMNPFHHIPVLMDGDFAVVESFAILDYIEAKFPVPSLLPSELKALGVVKMVQMLTINELLPAIRPLMQQLMGLGEPDRTTIHHSQESAKMVLRFFEKLLGESPFFGSDQITLADIVAGTVIIWMPNLGISLEDYPQLSRWCANLKQRESWQQTEPSPESINRLKKQMQEMRNK